MGPAVVPGAGPFLADEQPAVVADPDLAQPPPGNVMLNIKQAWQYSTGAGVTVALIDTGVTPNPRFPALSAGGDYAESLRRFRDHGLAVYGTFVFGYDNDDAKVIHGASIPVYGNG